MRIEDEYTASMAQMRAALRPRWPKSAAPFSACARSTRSSVSDSLVPTARCKRCVLLLGVDSYKTSTTSLAPQRRRDSNTASTEREWIKNLERSWAKSRCVDARAHRRADCFPALVAEMASEEVGLLGLQELLGDEPGEEGNEVRNHVLSGRCLFRSAPRVRRVRSRTGIVSLSA